MPVFETRWDIGSSISDVLIISLPILLRYLKWYVRYNILHIRYIREFCLILINMFIAKVQQGY